MVGGQIIFLYGKKYFFNKFLKGVHRGSTFWQSGRLIITLYACHTHHEYTYHRVIASYFVIIILLLLFGIFETRFHYVI